MERAKTEIRETKARVRARRKNREEAIIKRTKKKKLRGKGLRKFELVDGSFQEAGRF